MDFGHYSSPIQAAIKETASRLYTEYLYHSGSRYSSPVLAGKTPAEEPGSLEGLLSQESRFLFEKIVDTALRISERVRIYRDINQEIDYSWLYLRSIILELEQFYRVSSTGPERRKCALQSELLKLEGEKRKEKIECWKDIIAPSGYLLSLSQKYREQMFERKLLGGS